MAILPQLSPVKSSNIEAVGYHEPDLFVKFKGGDTWRYSGVPPATHREMMRAESLGSYFHKHIKSVITGEKVAPPAEKNAAR